MTDHVMVMCGHVTDVKLCDDHVLFPQVMSNY